MTLVARVLGYSLITHRTPFKTDYSLNSEVALFTRNDKTDNRAKSSACVEASALTIEPVY